MPDSPAISPFGLIADTDQASEILILSFTASLEFFERFALGAARATQARVSVIADATSVSADPAVVRGAGRTYLDARAVCPANTAFHPKLLVIAGPEHATLAIGSGNLTLPGWHHNAELWAVLNADRQRGSAAIRQATAFLRQLGPAGIRLSHGAAPALERVAERLDALAADEPGPRVVSSVFGPIIDQLPEGPVDELLLYAPFFDPDAEAVDRLVQRLQPSQLTVCLQPTMTSVDGGTLADVLARHGGHAKSVIEDRYRHGKLIEWREDDRRFALTGSPNLSRSALLRAVGHGGNCELGLVSDITATLAPPLGDTLHAHDLRAVARRRTDREQPAVVLLGATVTDEGLRILLRDPLDSEGRLQSYANGVWSDQVAVPGGGNDITIAGGDTGWLIGVAVRVRSAAGETSNEVFIADLSRVLRTSRPHAGRALTDGDNIFKDPRLFEEFLADAQLLKPHLLPTAGGGGRDGKGTAAARPRRPQSLEEYLDACASVLGDPMLHFALGLPALPGSGGDTLDAFGGGLEGEEGGEEDPEDATPLVIPSFTAYSDYRRRRFQRWCVQLADLAPSLVLVGRVLAVRLIVRAAAGQLWVDREEWTPLLGRALRSLAAPGEAYTEERAAAASMGAVGLAILRSQIRRFSRSDPVAPIFYTAARELQVLLSDVDPDRVAEYGNELVDAFGPAVAVDGVEDLLDEMAHPPDPLDRAVELLADEYDLEAHRRGSVIEYADELEGDPHWKLLLATGVAEPATPVAAVGDTPRGKILAIWQPPRFVILHKVPKGVWGAIHQIKDGLSPRLLAATREDLAPPEQRWSVNEPIPSDAADAVKSVRLDPEAPFGR